MTIGRRRIEVILSGDAGQVIFAVSSLFDKEDVVIASKLRKRLPMPRGGYMAGLITVTAPGWNPYYLVIIDSL